MRRSLRAVTKVAFLFSVIACAEQEMDSAETGEAHTPAVAPTTVTPADTTGGHGARADTLPTTTTH